MPMPSVANRKSRRSAEKAGRHTRTAAFTGVALAATALTAAIAPPAAPDLRKIEVALAADAYPTYPMFGIGPLGDLVTNLLNLTGNNPLSVPTPLGTTYTFPGGAPTAQSIYKKLNDGMSYFPVEPFPAPCSGVAQSFCRTGFALSTGFGALGITEAVRALIESAQGNTRAGFDPIKPATGGTGLTNLPVITLNNVLRADGGIAARFPDVLKALGINPTTVDTGESGPNKDGSSIYNWTLNISWPYNTLADFPITANPFSVANSLLAVIPPPKFIDTLLQVISDPLAAFRFVVVGSAGTAAFQGFGENVFPLPTQFACSEATPRCAGWSGFVGADLTLLGMLQGQVPPKPPLPFDDFLIGARYTNEIPLTYPTRIASWLINPLLKQAKSPYLLGTPLSDILTPALKILVNIGYDDVLTPDKLDSIEPLQQRTYASMGYQAYDRTYFQLTPDKPTPFAWFNNPAITPEEMAKVPGAVWTAFTEALKEQAAKPGFGIVVPNPDVPTTPISGAVTAPAQAISVKPAAAESTPASIPDAEPTAVETPAAPVTESAPAIKELTLPDAPADDTPAAPATPSHRGGHAAGAATGDSGGSNGGSNGGGSGSHRGARG